jgi:type II secretory pathway component GspD/PulD (secretin)
MLKHANRPLAPTSPTVPAAALPSASRLAPALALVLAAAAFQTANAVPQTAANQDNNPQTVQVSDATLVTIKGMIAQGQYVRARLTAADLLRDTSRSLSEEDRMRAHEMLRTADDRIARMDPFEVSLRHAQIALEQGDLATARRHATAVSTNDAANAEQSNKANEILRSVDIERASLAPFVADAIAQIRENFENHDYARAKGNLDAIQRAAVVLSPEQQDVVDMYRTMIVSREEVMGAPFAMPHVSLGVLQPDTVTRRGEEAQPEQPPAEQPVNLPEAQPDPQPGAQPEAQDPPAQPEVAGPDLIQVAMRAEAMGILGEANRAFEQNNWVPAQSRYRQLQDEYAAYLTDDQRSHIASQLERIAIELNQPGEDQIGDVLRRGEAVRSQTQAEFSHLMTTANAALRTGDLAGARQSQAEARLIINSRRQYFNEDQYNTFDQQIETLKTRIERETLAAEARANEERTKAFEQDAEKARKQASSDRNREINELIDRARSYQAEGQYEEALQTIERLLFIEPRNPSGLLLRDVYRDILIFTEGRRIQSERPYRFAKNSLNNQDAGLPPLGIMNFPADWRAISLKRGELSGFQDTPENASIYADLRNTRVPEVKLDDNTLEDVVRYVESITSHNIDVDWNELANISIQPETTTSLTLRSVSVATLMDRVLDKVSTDDLSRAAWEVRDGIIIISSDAAIRRNTHLHIYDIKDLLLDIPDYDDVPDIDLQQSLQQSQGGRGGGGGGGQSPFRNTQQNDENEDRRTLEDRTRDIIDIITSNVDFDGWVDNGGETGTIQNYNGNLIITNTVANHAQINGLLQKLRAVRAMQINVETRFLLVNQGFFEQIGFDLDVYWNANNNQFRQARALDPTILPSDFFGPGGERLREVTGTTNGIDLNGDGDTADPGEGGGVTQGVANPRSNSIIGTPSNSLGLTEALLPGTGIAATVLGGAAPAVSLAGSFVDDIQVDYLVKATQADQRSVALTAPRLTFMNGQIANIFVATQQAYISDLQPIVANSAVGFDPTIAVVTEGVTMVIEGVISSDRRYVTMNVDVGISRIDGFASQPVTAVAGGQLVNSADTASFIQLPQVTVTRVRTSVTVPDQGTVLLGGQRITTEFEVETGVPVLSKIPILNRFFSNRITSRDEQTLLILIRPQVLIQNELEEENSPGLNDFMGSGFGLGG